MTDAELMAALEAGEMPLGRGNRYAMPSTDGETAVRNAIAALSPTARELMAWVARHHGAVLRVDDFRAWAGVSRDEALAAIADLVSRTAVHRLGKRRGREAWSTTLLAHTSTRIANAETDELEGVVVSLGFWVREHPRLAAAWRVQPFDPGPSAALWRPMMGDPNDD